jgi:hypothetical protein
MRKGYKMEEENIQEKIHEMMKPRDMDSSESESETSSHSGSESESGSSSGSESSGSGSDSEYEIDLSNNEIYKGIYSFFEDEEGHNILDYISLLHTEMIGIGKTLTNVKVMRKDMTRIADSLEKIVAMKEMEIQEKMQRRHEKSK